MELFVFIYGLLMIPIIVLWLISGMREATKSFWLTLVFTAGFSLLLVLAWITFFGYEDIPVYIYGLVGFMTFMILGLVYFTNVLKTLKEPKGDKGPKGDTGEMGLPGKNGVGSDRWMKTVLEDLVRAVDRLEDKVEGGSPEASKPDHKYTQEEQDRFDLMRYGRLVKRSDDVN